MTSTYKQWIALPSRPWPKSCTTSKWTSFKSASRHFFHFHWIWKGTVYAPELSYANLTYLDVSNGTVPSRQYSQSAFISRVHDLFPSFERFMQLLGGCVLWGDRSYKVIKFVFTPSSGKKVAGGETVRSFDSIYTIMNEHGLIIAIYFIHSRANKEISGILKIINERYKIHGYDEVEMFYTDSCCSEYRMICKAIPSLALGDKVVSDHDGAIPNEQDQAMSPLPIPKSWNRSGIKTYN